MKEVFLSSYLYLIMVGTIILSSCETEGVSRITFDKNTFDLHVGQKDTLVSTIIFTGEIDKLPVEWIVEDPTVISVSEETDVSETSKSGSFTKTVVISALKAGNTTLTIKVGDKTHSCQVGVTLQTYSFSMAYASNWGDFYDTGTNNFDMYLLENTLSINVDGEVQGNGNMIYLDFYLPLTQNTLTNGSFDLSTEGVSNTFYPGEIIESEGQQYTIGTRLINYNNNSRTVFLVVDGDFIISKNGNNFIIEGELVLESNEIITFSYSGTVEEQDLREEPVEINPTLTKGYLIHYGDAYQSGTTNNFVAYLNSSTVNFADDLWVGDVLMLEFNTELSVKDYIPNGTYQMMTELTYEQLSPYSLVFGYTDNDGNEWGTWYYGQSGEQTKKLNAGNMNVTKSGDIYTIQYELYDKSGSKIWGSFNGSLIYIDATQGVPAAAPAKAKASISKRIPLNDIYIFKKQPNRKISKTGRFVEISRKNLSQLN